MKQRFWACITAIVVLSMAILPSAQAKTATVSNSTALNFLAAIGSLEREQTASPEREMTRAEFVGAVMPLMGNGIAASYEKPEFLDVTLDTPYAAQINTAYRLGLIDGADTNMFRPEQAITADEAIKILISITDNTPAAMQKGGYPVGYRIVAAERGITDDAAAYGNLSISDAAVLLYNALEAPMLEQTSLNEYIVGERTLLYNYLSIYRRKGGVTAFGNAALTGGGYTEKDTICIDGIKYILKDTDFAVLPGHSVEFWYSEDEASGDRVIIYIEEDMSGSETLFIDESELKYEDKKFSARQLVYEKEDGKSRTVRLDTERVFINGMSKQLTAADFDFSDYDGGYVKLIANKNGDYDYVEIIKYKNHIVSSVNIPDEAVFFENGRKLLLNREDYSYDILINITDMYYNELDVNDIKKGDVVSIYESSGYIGAFVSNVSLSAVVESYDSVENKIAAGSQTYKIAGNVSCQVGKSYLFSLDFRNKITKAELESISADYVYLINVFYEEESARVMLRLFNPANNTVETCVTADKFFAGSASNKTRYTQSEEALEGVKAALSPTADKGGNGIAQLVQLRKNSKGEISEICAARVGASKTAFSCDYCTSGMTSSSYGFIDGRYRIFDGQTLIILVPNDRNRYDKYTAQSAAPYACTLSEAYLYDIDSDTNIPNAIVVNYDKVIYTSDSILYSAFAMVARVRTEWIDDEEKYAVTLFTAGRERTDYYSKDEYLKDRNGVNLISVSSLKKGDLIQGVERTDGFMGIRVICRRPENASELQALTFGNVNTTYGSYGTIRAISDKYIIVENPELGVEIMADASSAKIYRFDSGENSADIVSMADLAYGQTVVFRKTNGLFNDIVIYE